MRSLLCVLLLLVLASCSSEPPHSAYYVVSFAPGQADLGPAAKAVIDRAARDATGDQPRAVVLKAYVGADSSGRALCDQRLQVVQQALIGGGAPASLIHATPTPTDAVTFERLGNGVVIQLERGELPPERPPASE